LPVTQPRSQSGSWTLTRAGQLSSVRRELQRVVQQHRPAADVPAAGLAALAERLALVVTELASNALRHAAPPVGVVLSSGTDGWLVVVTDPWPAAAPIPREPDAERGGGQGLHLVQALSQHVGWYATLEQKSVWAQVRDEPSPELAAILRRTTR
jgi:two-component sensor histidine kinase